MLEKTEGLVLSSFKYAETSVITKIFTRKFGLLSFMVKGARNAKSGRGNLLQPLNFLLLDIYYREQKNLLSLKDINIDNMYPLLFTDFHRRSIAIFLVEIIGKCIHERQENKELFDFCKDTFVSLNEIQTDITYKPLFILFEISKILGCYPNLNEGDFFDLEHGCFSMHQNYLTSGLNALESASLRRALKLYEQPDTLIRLYPDERRQLLEKMLLYFQLHIPGFSPPNSPTILHQILE